MFFPPLCKYTEDWNAISVMSLYSQTQLVTYPSPTTTHLIACIMNYVWDRLLLIESDAGRPLLRGGAGGDKGTLLSGCLCTPSEL